VRFLGLLLLPFIAGCDPTPWQGWVYPDRHNLAVAIHIGNFESLEQCRQQAHFKLHQHALYEDGEKLKGDYECGYSCKPDGYGLNICKKTER
jgi:hypothetical protein